jgi:endonuclease YncB( thermonuclease family)
MLRRIKMALAGLIGLTIITVLVTARSTLAPETVGVGGTEYVLEIPETGELPEGPDRAVEPPALATGGAKPGIETRNVGGGLIAAPVNVGGPLERIEALPQPASTARPQTPDPVKADQSMRWRLIYNSVISAAGVFEGNGTVVVLPDIDIVAVNETCTASDGVKWPCGMVARTAFRNYVKGRAITCRIPDTPPQGAYAAECLLAGQDMAAWLVEHGWARAKPDRLYADLETAAKGQRRGIHGNPPLGVEAMVQP